MLSKMYLPYLSKIYLSYNRRNKELMCQEMAANITQTDRVMCRNANPKYKVVQI